VKLTFCAQHCARKHLYLAKQRSILPYVKTKKPLATIEDRKGC